jgi:hypothetical protein
MALDRTPLYVGGGAEHSPEVIRQAHYDSMGGAEGVSRWNSLRVWSESVPTTTIRVLPGGATINNRYPGGDGQAYSARNISQTSVPVTATGSTGGRTDLLVLRILDPQYEGQPPADPTDFDYTRFEIIEGVPAGTETFAELGLSYPAIELAKLTIPANTATITQAMITDLRSVARPKSHTETRALSIVTGQEDTISSTSNYPDGGETWPEAAEAAWGFFKIPEWATQAKVIMHWDGIMAPGGDTWGWIWVQIGYSVNPDHVVTQGVWYDTTGVANKSRQHAMVAGTIGIPAALRGGKHKIYGRANVLGGATSARLQLNSGSTMSLDVTFLERPE